MFKFILTLCLFLCLHKSFAQSSCKYTINGHVVDKELNTSLNNATISITELNKTTISDIEGNFNFTNLCSGWYTISVTHIGCVTTTQKIQIKQADAHVDILLMHDFKEEKAALITALQDKKSSGFKVSISGKSLDASKGGTLTEIMQKLNGVSLLQTGNTISKPVIHGLFGSRVLLINNEVRQEGQQWGNEHSPELDPFLANKIEVIKGVDELQYGSDAIGGVIVVSPKTLIGLKQNNSSMYTGYNTNNKMYYGSAIIERKTNKNINFRIQSTIKKAANTSTPDYKLNNTAFNEINNSITILKQHKQNNVEVFVSNFNTNLGVFKGAHIGNITDLNTAIANSSPNIVYLNQNTYNIDRPKQQVNHFLAKLKYVNNKKLTANFNLQHNNRKEFDIVRNSNTKTPQLNLNILTLNQTIQYEHQKIKNSNGNIGLNVTQQFNSYEGRYIIPNYTAMQIGLFAIQKWKKPHWEYQAGVRSDVKWINTRRLRNNGTELNYNFNYKTLAVSGNIIHNITNHLKSNIAASISSRAPYVNELLSNGIHHGTATYEQGNLLLKTEQALFLNWNWEYNSHNQLWKIDASIHQNLIKNYIYQQAKPTEPVLTIAGAFPKLVWQQTNASLSGIDISQQFNISKKINILQKASYLYARNLILKDYLIGIPPFQLNQTVNFNAFSLFKKTTTNIAINGLTVATQKQLPQNFLPEFDYKAAPGGYTIFGIEIMNSFLIKQKESTVQVGVTNLTNKRYRNYLNAFRYFTDETGRNFFIKFNINL
jgi:iron complex outermembrane recepter protein